MKTRAGSGKAPAPADDGAMAKPAAEPPKFYTTLILPSDASEDARFIQLQDPRTSRLSRYYFCPKLGVFEFTSVSPPTTTPRSFLFVNSTYGETQRKDVGSKGQPAGENGFTSKTGQLHVATPVDIMFFILPIIVPSSHSSERTFFQPLDDIIDANEDISPHLRKVLYTAEFRKTVERRMASVCETIDGDSMMFKFSEKKLVEELLAKAEMMVKNGLPPSLEARFVHQALEPPMVSVSKISSTQSGDETNDNEKDTQPTQNTIDPQTVSEMATTQTLLSTNPTEPADSQEEISVPRPNYSPEIAHLMRLRAALSFIQSSYLQPNLSIRVSDALSSSVSPKDFTALDEYLQNLAKLRAEAQASRAMYDMSRRKRGYEDDETAEEVAEKKRKAQEEEKKRKAQEEEKKKKASMSRGVRDLKKVNTSGMQKLSSFFAKAPAKK
ncbi:hypothetical protein H112_07697 [Trichophyton rubrum D6]|uniref:Ribonuclease H2 subunit B n=3 Tax=Trichophyton rubrum TaxID=5551 RepID=A0A178EU18_TRIRU|nr:uncharacterized protein TERG_00296 [Trichophyton rubrum CBS 118892]EZF11104.1 hypothetical protein H100_07722 [Trichophyton rubrum MR850]EZF37968.1 hypothetical protein H102_07687 [Trichophyton rubrum CBS 100081]EZF48603.1 hypothetical protein H103_07710 [Trichophyton rubrum CBS 288.86]EZF59290.1 hypothetical protein H104_07658 [Trichophyton rubrum CBS 289.86]EZF80628.1 hypothetical protein H110_07706 [Trichophyton rubrum MR1448]EZF91174.1 hypothetical protein H113_07768 [Trichophyton rubr